MKILGIYLQKQIRTGGARRYFDLLEGLASRGNTVYMLVSEHLDYNSDSINFLKLPILYKNHKFPPASYLFLKCVKENLEVIKNSVEDKKIPIDYIIIFGDTHLKTALFLKKELKISLFYGFRCNDIDRAHLIRAYGGLSLKEYLFSVLYELINRYREKQVAKHAESISFINNADKERFLIRTKPVFSNIVVIPNHIGPPRCTYETKNINKSEKVEKIVYVGSLSRNKGVWDLLKSLSVLIKKGHTFLKCYLLGRMEDTDETIRLIKKLNLEKNIFIEGYKDPFPYFQNCDLFVYPTLYDSFGNVIAEALHTGCPVMASNVGGVTELLLYPELLFSSGNINEISDKIERCITDNEFYRNIRNLCSKRTLIYEFDWIEKYENVMKNMLHIKKMI